MKPMFITSFAGLIAVLISSFFAFALQGVASAALACGVFAIIALSIHALTIPTDRPTTPIYSPSRSQRLKLRKLRIAR